MHKLITMVFFWNLWWLGIGAAIGQPAPLQAPAPNSAQMVPIVEVGGFMSGIGGLKQIVDLPVVLNDQAFQGQQVVLEGRSKAIPESVQPIQSANAEGDSRRQQRSQGSDDWSHVLMDIIQILFPIVVFIPSFRAALDAGKEV